MKLISLGIESSCDDTSASVVTSDKEILSNIVISQINEHSPYKGVVPEIASRAHMSFLEFAIKEALKKAEIELRNVDIISATGGPGLIGGVIVGTMFGKAIATVTKKPYLAINHLEGHALTSRLTSNIEFPYLLLLISGGHCQFLIVKDVGSYELLGQTLDDSVGEAFDKVAKMLDLGFPGGPIVEERAKLGQELKYEFPKSMCDRKGCEMSLSGLKTSVMLLIKSIEITDQVKNDICASFQYTIRKILEYKISEAVKIFTSKYSSKNFVLSGGVAANQYLVYHLSKTLENLNFSLYSPPMKLCTDNAAMIAWAGIERYKKRLISKLDFCPKARWSLI